RPAAPQHALGFGPPRSPPSQTAEPLDQQDRVEGPIGKGQTLAIGLSQTRRQVAALGSCHEGAQHAQRQVDAYIVVACRYERPADPPGAGAEIEKTWLPHVADGGEDCRADRWRNAVGQSAMMIEARRGNVIGRHKRCFSPADASPL